MQSKNSENRIVVWNSLTFIFSVGINFIVYSLFYRTFNPEIFGIYLTYISIFLLGNSLDLGIGISTIKIISEKKILNDYDYINRFVTTFFGLYILIGIIISSLLYANFLLTFNSVAKNLISLDAFSIRIVIYFFILFVAGFFKVILEGFSQYVIVGKFGMVTSLINLLFAIAVYIYKLDIFYLLNYNIAINVFNLIIFVFLIKVKTEVKFRLKYFNFSILRSNISHNMNIQISYILGNSIEYIVKFLIGKFLSFGAVTYYENAKKVLNIVSGLLNNSQRNLLNKISQYSDHKRLINFLKTEFFVYPKISNSYSIFVFGVCNFFICLLLKLWFQNPETILFYTILVIPYAIINFGSPLYNVLLLDKGGKHLILIQFINLVSTGGLLFFFLGFYDNVLGISGYVFSIILNTVIILRIFETNYSFSFEFIKNETDLLKLASLILILIIQFGLFYFTDINFLAVSALVSLLSVPLFYNEVKFFFSKIKDLRI